MKVFPESAVFQLEFNKVKALLTEHCRSEYAKSKAENLRIHTQKEFIGVELRQSHEFRQLLLNGIYFPNDYILNLAKDVKLLGIPGAVLGGDQFIQIRKLAENINSIFRWFDNERRLAYEGLSKVIGNTYYEKNR